MTKYVWFLLLFSSFAWSHGGERGDSLGVHSWNFEWHIWAGLGALATLYFAGWTKARKRKLSRGQSSRLNLFFFAAAMAALTASLVSPIDAYSDVLGWVHMVQHTLLLMAAAPLLVLAAPGFYATFVLPKTKTLKFGVFKKIYRWALKASRFSRPVMIWLLYALTLWVWHLPKFYEAALANPLVHDFQHLGFFAASFLFWRVALDPYGQRIHPAVGVLY
ncbi:MAG: cytochrome c oxidase assembly protein, partial [Bacteriovoracaceae bacterium]